MRLPHTPAPAAFAVLSLSLLTLVPTTGCTHRTVVERPGREVVVERPAVVERRTVVEQPAVIERDRTVIREGR